MPRIDDRMGQIKHHAQGTPRSVPTELVVNMAGWVPYVGDKIKQAIDLIRGDEKNSRLEFLLTAIVEVLDDHEKAAEGQHNSIEEIKNNIKVRLDTPEFMQTLAVAIERLFFLANERKTKRFAAVLGSTVINETSEQEFEDAAFFIRALDELSEDDIKVLSYFYKHQVKIVQEGHAMTYREFFDTASMRLLWEGIGELGMQRDYFYARCYRLTGYGLMLPLERPVGHGTSDQLYFRMTLLGKRLVEILQERPPSLT
jgi:hypothetical protein